MWPLKKPTEEVKEDQRGKNLNSLAALAAINAEKRLTRRQEREELERLRAVQQSATPPPVQQQATQSSSRAWTQNAPPAAPGSSSTMTAASQFFEDMMRYEQWKQTVYNVEEAKRMQIRGVLEKEFERRLEEARSAATETDPVDPMMESAGKYLLDLLFKAGSGESQAPLPPAAIAAQLPQDSAVTSPSPPTPPSQEMPKTFSNLADPRQEEADMLADAIENAYPDLCQKARTGEISKERAIAMMIDSRQIQNAQLGELIYNAIMDVEDDAPGTG